MLLDEANYGEILIEKCMALCPRRKKAKLYREHSRRTDGPLTLFSDCYKVRGNLDGSLRFSNLRTWNYNLTFGFSLKWFEIEIHCRCDQLMD